MRHVEAVERNVCVFRLDFLNLELIQLSIYTSILPDPSSGTEESITRLAVLVKDGTIRKGNNGWSYLPACM